MLQCTIKRWQAACVSYSDWQLELGGVKSLVVAELPMRKRSRKT
jgi:hypothetical protein